MLRELPFRFPRALLTLLTIAAVLASILNFQQQRRFELPEDGVAWLDTAAGVEASRIHPAGPAARSGMQPGDRLLAINGVEVKNALRIPQILFGIGAWKKAEYTILRQGVELRTTLIVQPAEGSPILYYLYVVGLMHLLIGLFVFYRREGAPLSQHFYVYCLASFLVYCFHYTGKLNNFDRAMYWGNVWALLFMPALFLHFCWRFSQTGPWSGRPVARTALVYLPPFSVMAAYLAAAMGVARTAWSSLKLSWTLDRISLGLLALYFLAAALALEQGYRRTSETEDTLLRQQLKWLRRGTCWGIAPFVAVYAIPYLLGVAPHSYMSLAVLSLGLIPLTFAYAILRHRLLDVDVIFRRGFAYSLATMAVLGAFYVGILTVGDMFHRNFQELGQAGWITAVLVAAFLFQPLRAWIQERLDRYFYRERYDYRRTLVTFARELSAETNLEAMLRSVTERLAQTLGSRRVAIFLGGEGGRWELARGLGLRDRQGRAIRPGDFLDLSFLEPARPESSPTPKPYLFFESTRWRLDGAASVRSTIADLDLTYYLPCSARGRTVAFLGLGRTESHDYLSGEDLELLVTLGGYLGIAVDNARLYHSLQQKVEQYERLKDFSENIVESIHVGILAVDLEDRVESWNTQLELMYGVSRDQAVGRPLAELFPEDLVKEFVRVREETGIHNIYKFRLRPETLPAPPSKPLGDRILNIAIAPLVAKNFDRIGRLIIFDDVTDRIELEQQLLQAEKMSSIGLLAAGVAHEVTTPLAVISTYAQMLAKQVSQDEQKARLLEKIAAQTFRASEIVNSLLNFSRTSATEFSRVHLNQIIRETCSLVEHQFKKAGIRVEAELDEQLPEIEGNSGKLQQVLLNLFLNAKDAMAKGGVLTVRTSSGHNGSGGAVRVEVADTGVGIAAEDLNRIYDPFFTTKGGQKGTGLGLSVSYGIIQEHSGTISAESQPGKGSLFRLEFPPASKVAPEAAGGRPGLRKEVHA
ncbi:MAG: PAS domain S-box protein [Acidobacteria bacterium]|nr:PAS domain S-box protein [Acidobacteriota bacterium]